MVQGQVFLKGRGMGGGGVVTPFLFNFFKFFQGSPLPFAKLCYEKKKKKKNSATIISWKKVVQLSKKEPENIHIPYTN